MCNLLFQREFSLRSHTVWFRFLSRIRFYYRSCFLYSSLALYLFLFSQRIQQFVSKISIRPYLHTCVCVCVSELVPILLLIYELCVTQNVPNKNQNKQTKHIFFTLSIQMFGLCVCTRVLERACSRLCFILLSSSIVCVMHPIINIDSVFASMYFNCVQFPIQ